MIEQMSAGEGPEDGDPDGYRTSHLMDDLADAFGDHIGTVAPFGRGGLKPRVTNRVTFHVTSSEGAGIHPEFVNDRLDSDGWAWTTGEPGEYVILGRAIRDLRELRDGDRIHINKRGGPFVVYRVMEQPTGPEVLQRGDQSITVELANADTDTDWMVVQWDGDPDPWAYVRTKDKRASGGFRHRKVERVERAGRIGPARLFAPPADMTEDVERYVPREVERARDHYLGENRTIHPMDLDRVDRLFQKPVPDVFSPEDANLIREFLLEMTDWHERQAGGLELETDEDKALAADRQASARLCKRLADAFQLLKMDAVDATEDTDLWVCEDCGQAFLNKFKYPTHRRDCGVESTDGGEQADEQDGHGGDGA